MQLSSVRRNPIARNEDRQKLTQNCDFTGPVATLSQEMRFDRQKLRQNCDFHGSGATLSHAMRFDRPKLLCVKKVCVKVSVCKSSCVQKRLCVKASVCKKASV